MTFIFQFYDSVVKFAQVFLQFLNFVLNRKTRSGIFVDRGLDLCAHRQEIASLGCRAVMAPPNRAVDHIIL